MNTTLSKAYHINKNSDERKENDYYPTPPIATYTLIKEYDIPKTLLEPAAGRGWISHELKHNGFEVYSSDLFGYNNPLVEMKTGIDFLQTKKDDRVEAVITNPPFKNRLAEKFVRHSINLYDTSFILCRTTFMESLGRYDLFKETPPTEILVFANRINCDENAMFSVDKQLSGMVSYAWFIWDKRKDYTNKIRWINSKDHLESFLLTHPYEYAKFKVDSPYINNSSSTQAVDLTSQELYND